MCPFSLQDCRLPDVIGMNVTSKKAFSALFRGANEEEGALRYVAFEL